MLQFTLTYKTTCLIQYFGIIRIAGGSSILEARGKKRYVEEKSGARSVDEDTRHAPTYVYILTDGCPLLV